MKLTSIAIDRLLATVELIRKSKIDYKLKRELVDQIMKDCELIRRADMQHIVCIKHAKLIRGYASHASIYRAIPRLPVHVFKICCRDFFDRRELEALPPKADYSERKHSVKKVKVGMK